MRLRLVYQGSFAKSEITLFEEAMRKNKDLILGADDCVLLVSKSGKLLKFVRRVREVQYKTATGKNGKTTQVVSSELYRITGTGTWSPYMLGNYAAELGIELEGIKKFESYFRALADGTGA